MNTTRHDIAQAILQLSAVYSSEKVSKAVAAYLVRERRTAELDQIMREVVRLREQRDGQKEVDFTSAFALTPRIKKEMSRQLGDKVVINETIDKSVLGGVRVETNDTLLDLTVRSRLDRLRQGVK